MHEVQRLRPERHPRNDARLLAPPIDENEQTAAQRGMQRVLFSTQPKNIEQGDMREAGQVGERAYEKKWQVPELVSEILEKALPSFVLRLSSARSRVALCYLVDSGVSEIFKSDAELAEQVSEGDAIEDRKRKQFVDVPRQLVGSFVVGKRTGRCEIAVIAKDFGDCAT